ERDGQRNLAVTVRLRDEPDESLPDYYIRRVTGGQEREPAVFAGTNACFTRMLVRSVLGPKFDNRSELRRRNGGTAGRRSRGRSLTGEVELRSLPDPTCRTPDREGLQVRGCVAHRRLLPWIRGRRAMTTGRAHSQLRRTGVAAR